MYRQPIVPPLKIEQPPRRFCCTLCKDIGILVGAKSVMNHIKEAAHKEKVEEYGH